MFLMHICFMNVTCILMIEYVLPSKHGAGSSVTHKMWMEHDWKS